MTLKIPSNSVILSGFGNGSWEKGKVRKTENFCVDCDSPCARSSPLFPMHLGWRCFVFHTQRNPPYFCRLSYSGPLLQRKYLISDSLQRFCDHFEKAGYEVLHCCGYIFRRPHSYLVSLFSEAKLRDNRQSSIFLPLNEMSRPYMGNVVI